MPFLSKIALLAAVLSVFVLPGCRKFGNFWDKDDAAGKQTGPGGNPTLPAGPISGTMPASGAYRNNTQVSYTFADNCSSASITWVRTGGAADAGGAPAGTHTQALTGPELLSGAHNNITLTNNPTLADGAIYTVTFACTDMALNVLSPVVATGVTYDTTLPVITVTAPASTSYRTTTNVDYSLSEACQAGSITWTQTGGTADPGSPRVQALTGPELAAGAHGNITLANNPALVDGAIYSVAFNCTDLAGNAATTITRTNVTYDFTVPVISSISPANGAFVSTAKVTYTLSENCASGNVTWTRTGGTADGASPRVQALVGAELNAGLHNDITLTNNPALVSGTIYTVSFNCTDAAAQAATPPSSTSVTFDNTLPIISAVTPANSAYVNSTQVSYTLSEACTSATITWTRTGGNADGLSPHVKSLTAGELNSGAHNNIVITNNPTLTDGAVYSIAFDCSDAAGNAAAQITRTNVTYDPSAVVISGVAPASSSFQNTTKVTYTLSEACGTGSVTWTRTGGNPDGGSPRVSTLTGGELAVGAHTNITLTNNPALVDGTIYTVQFDCTDLAANASTPVVVTNVTYDFTAPVISVSYPTSTSAVNNTQVGYNLSEACTTGTVNWQWTSGTADSSHNQGLTAPEMTSGLHSNFTISNNPVLVSGATYSVIFNCSDAAGNAAATITRTNVMYDITPPTISIKNLKNNGTVHSGHVIGPANDVIGTIATVELQLDGGAWTAATYGSGTWKFALPTGASTWRDRSPHTINARATDTAGNVTTAGLINVKKGNNQDVNGDGYPDVMVGAWAYSSSTGRAYIFYGSDTGIPDTTAGAPNLIGTGSAASAFFGRSNALGDFNGDGFADVAVSAYGTTTNTGQVYIYPGGVGGAAGSPSVTITGTTSGDKFGAFITASDTNNDGYADLVVGANGYSATRGRVYFFYGGGSGITITAAASASQIFTGETGANNFGGSITLGDFNGDTFTDLAVGAPDYSAAASNGRGYLFYGTAGGITGVIAAPAQAFGTGVAGLDFFTGGLASGDLNGDGVTDLVVGSYGYSAGANTGRLYIYYGPSITLNVTANTGSPGTTITGTNAAAFFTTNMIVADFNSDGYADLAVGAYGCSLNPAGCAYVFSGQPGNLPSGVASIAGYITTGATSGNNFGRAVGASDINGDGYPDLLVGANLYTTNTGRGYVFLSSGAGPTVTTATSAATTLTGQTTNSEFGITFFR